MPGHQRSRQLDQQVVELVPVFAAHLQYVAEPGGREQRGARALALDQRVRDESRAVHELLDVARVQARVGKCPYQTFFNRSGGFVVRGEHLADGDDTGVVEYTKVGERATDVDTDPQAGHAVSLRYQRGDVLSGGLSRARTTSTFGSPDSMNSPSSRRNARPKPETRSACTPKDLARPTKSGLSQSTPRRSRPARSWSYRSIPYPP